MMVRSAAVALLLVAVSGRDVRAELCAYEDKEGIIHITDCRRRAAAAANGDRVTVQVRSGKKVQVNSADEYDAHIRDAAEMYHLPYELVKAVIAAESNFDPEAVSRAGARGLMQLMPATADEMYVWDPHDPIDAIYGGARYLRHLANQFGGDFIKTVAAYNAGPEAVRKAQGVPRYSETRTYVQKVVKFYKQFKGR